jgi:hypothetical protein
MSSLSVAALHDEMGASASSGFVIEIGGRAQEARERITIVVIKIFFMLNSKTILLYDKYLL